MQDGVNQNLMEMYSYKYNNLIDEMGSQPQQQPQPQPQPQPMEVKPMEG